MTTFMVKVQLEERRLNKEHQESIAQLRKEYTELEDRLQAEHEAQLVSVRTDLSGQIERLGMQILSLQDEVEKYKTLAGIQQMAQDALKSAEAASREAGLSTSEDDTSIKSSPSERVLAVTGTPNHSSSLSNGFSETPPPPPPPPPPLAGPPPPPPPPPPPFGSGPPPPPPPPPPPSIGGIPPPPPPNFASSSSTSFKENVKPIISPKQPMKPLFWKRLQVHSVKSIAKRESDIFWDQIQEETLNFDQLVDLFSKVPVEPKKKAAANRTKPKAVQSAKVIEPKRSQAVGILLSSLRLEFSDIEESILNLDTSVLDVEKFKAIYDNRPDQEELKLIKKQLEKHPEVPLDKPDQFLWDFHQIPHVNDRIFCFIFHSGFQENIATIDTKLNNLKMTCEILSTQNSVKRIFGLILACGNYMNGGSRTRGQADGFDLEILPKIKDVKGKDNRTSLLQFLVSHYIQKYDSDVMGTDRAKLPLPDPSDIHQAGLVNFDDIDKELKKLRKDFDSAEVKATKIISSSSHDNLEPFKSVMTSFFNKGRQELNEQEDNLKESYKLFIDSVDFFFIKPKNNEKEVTPEYFFSLWLAFCSDFKDIWKKEQHYLMKLKIKEAEEKVRRIKESKSVLLPPTRAKKVGGLKDRLSRLSKS